MRYKANKSLHIIYNITLVGVMAAMLEGGKLALAAIPNVEVVTLFTALFGYCFGMLGVIATIIFVLIEPMIYGVGTWIITYLIYWPSLALLFVLLRKLRLRSVALHIVPTLLALLMTVFFGVLSSLIDVGLLSGYFDRFWYRFGIYYARGIAFYIAQLVTNAVLFPTLFPFLSQRIQKISVRITSP